MLSKETVNTIITVAILATTAWTAWKVDRSGRGIREEDAVKAYDLGFKNGRNSGGD